MQFFTGGERDGEKGRLSSRAHIQKLKNRQTTLEVMNGIELDHGGKEESVSGRRDD